MITHYADSKLEIICGTPVGPGKLFGRKPYTRAWREVECANCLALLFGRSKWAKPKGGKPLDEKHRRELDLLSERDLVRS